MSEKNAALPLKEELAHPSLARPYVEIPTFGKFFKRNGIYDGKLFHSADKVTYTFILNKELISLHFDLNRRAIFYKGHNISNMSLSPEQIQHLEHFKEELSKGKESKKFVSDFEEVLQAYLKDHPASE